MRVSIKTDDKYKRASRRYFFLFFFSEARDRARDVYAMLSEQQQQAFQLYIFTHIHTEQTTEQINCLLRDWRPLRYNDAKNVSLIPA